MGYLRTRRVRLILSVGVLVLSVGVAVLTVRDLPIYLGLPLLAALGLHFVWRDRPGHPLYRLILSSAAALGAVACLVLGLYFVAETVELSGRGDPYASLTLYLALIYGVAPFVLAGLVFLCVLVDAPKP